MAYLMLSAHWEFVLRSDQERKERWAAATATPTWPGRWERAHQTQAREPAR
jgi:hypothetical protein